MTLEEQRKKQEEEAARAAAEAQAKDEAESQAAAQAAADSASASAQAIAEVQTQNAAQTAGAGQSANPFGPYASADDKAQAQGMRRKIAEESKGVKYKVVKYGEYTPREGMNPEIAKRINDMNKAGKLGHGQGTGYGIVNRIKVDYSSIRDIRQAAWFGMSVPMEERDKYAEQYAKATKQDKKSVIAQFETITGDKFFNVPKSDGSKVRAGNQAMKDIGLFDISGNRLFVDKATTADFIRAAQMDPNKATGEAVYKVAKAMSKIPGSIWYGNEVTADMFKPVESADLLLEDGESYADKLADMDKAFTFSNGFTQENYNAYLDLVEEYSKEYKDNPRVLGYFLRDLRSAYSTHTGVAPVSDAKASADIESRAQYYAESAEAGEAKNDGGVSWWEAIGRFLTGMDSEPDKTPAGTKVEKKTVDEIVSIIEAEEKKEEEEKPDAKQIASGGGSAVMVAGAPDVPEVGHFMSINDLPEPRLVASAFVSDVIPMSVYFGRDQNAAPKKDETFDPLGLGEEQLNRYKQKQGPTYQPQPKVDMVDAWTRRMQGQQLTDTEKKALGKYFNAETMGLFYGGSYGISNEQGAYGSAWITQEDAIAGRLKYGKTIGGLSTRLEASGLTGDARATAELALADFQQKVYAMAVNKDNGYDWLAAQENMYEYVISQNDDLIAEAESIDNMLRSAGAADVDAALEAQSEEENRYEAETQQVLSGTATKETLDDLARYHSQNWVDIDEDKTRQEFIESLRTYGEFFGDNGTYWQGNSAAAQEAAKIRSAQGGMQGFFDFRDALGMTAEGVIDDYTTAAMNIGVTLEKYLASAGIRSVDDILDISFDLMKAQGNAVINDPSIAESIDAANAATADGTVGDLIEQAGTRYDISTGEALELGYDIGKANRKEGFYQTAYMMVDKATYEANVDSVTRQYVEKYGFDGTAEEMYLRDLEEYMQSGALSDEMVAELKKNIQYAPSIFDIGYEIDPGWLKGKLRKTRAEAGKEVAMLNDVVKTLIPEDQELVSGISGLYQNVSGMATQLAVTGAMMLTGLGALAPFVSSATAYGFNTYAEAFDANYTYGPMKDKALAGRMAMLQTAAVTGINMAGAGSIGDVFFGSVAWDGVEAAFKAGGGKGWMALTKYLAGSSLNEAGEEMGELTVEKLFDVLDQEALAYENGEGFSVSRTFGRIFDSLDPQSTDYASLAKEFKQAFGGGLGYGMLFTLIGAGARAPGVRTGVKMYNQFDSVRMATDLFDGKTDISDESVGKVYAALAKDLQDPEFCKWLDGRSKQAINNRQMATAVLLGYGDTELEGAKKVAQLAKQYAAKSKAADEAALTGEETWMELADMVAAGDTSQIPAMDAAETEYQRSVTTSNEMKDAVAKAAGQLSENVRKWVASVSKGADLLTSATMKERFATIMNMRQGAASVITAMGKKVEADAEMLGEAIDADAQDALNVMQAEEYVLGEADADMDVPYDPETGMAEVEDLITDAADAASAAAGMDGIVDEDTLSAGKNGAKDAAGKVGGKLKSMLVQAYEALNNLGNEDLYEQIAGDYNAALEMAKEAGIKISDTLKALPELPRKRMAEAQASVEAMSAGIDQETNAPEPMGDTDPAMPRAVIDAKAQAQTGGENAPEPNTDIAPARPTADMTEYKLGVSTDANAKAEADAKAKAKAETEAKARADAEADKTAQDEFADTLNEVYNAATQEERDAAKAEMDAAAKTAAGQMWDPKRTARIERAADIVTGTTKEQRDAAKAQAQAEANVSAMDVEAYIEANHKNAPEDEKKAIREIWNAATKNTPLNVTKDIYQFAARVGKKFGAEIEFVETLDGERRGEITGNKIKIARDATQGDVVKSVIMHELMHKAEGSGKLYDKLQKMILDMKYGGDQDAMNADITQKVADYSAYYRAKNRTDAFTEENAKEEIVADYMGEILNGNPQMIERLVRDDSTLAKRIMNTIKDAISKFSGVKDPQLEQMKKTVKLFERALKKSKGNKPETKNMLAKPVASDTKGIPLAEDTNGAVSKYSLRSWTDDETNKVRSALIRSGHAEADVDRWINEVNGVAAIVAADQDRLDFEADDNQVMLKPNQEYVKTLDASTLCAKRLIYQGTFNAIQHILENRVLTSDDLIRIREMMKEMGYETPCGICYVESRRRNLGVFAKKWLDGYDAKGGYQPKLADVTTTDGLERMLREHPEVYQSFMAEMNRKGSNNPKVVQMRTDYRGDIRNLTDSQIAKIIDIGGLRVQSFSDFETPHLLDMMQAVLDMTAKDLTSQAYTKVPNFAWVFGDTGIKINLSLIGEGSGLDADGNLIFSSYEGMDFDEAMRLRDRYSENVGTILVGIDEDHIRAAMADPRIDYIIPFHKSGWGQKQLSQLSGMKGYKDFTRSQNERRVIGRTKTGKPKTQNVPENFHPVGPNGYWDFGKSGNENAATYLRMCEEDGRIPKFSQFLTKDADGHWVAPDGYWKLLIDFKMYDNAGKGAPQMPVRPNFNMDEARRVLGEYEGGANTLPVAQDVVERFVGEVQTKDKAANPATKYSLPSRSALEADILAWRQARQAEIDAAKKNDGVSQFAAKTVQNAPNVSDQIKAEFNTNPLLKTYRTDSNDAQVERALGNLKKNGFEKEAERLLNADTLTTDDGVEAGLMALYAFENDKISDGLDLALRYAIDGTEKAQAMQSRKLFSKMSPTHIKLKIGGELEKKLQDHIDTHKAEAEKVKEEAAGIDAEIRNLLGGDALKKANAQGSFKVTDSKWGIPINDKQRALIDRFKLNNVTRPGMNYNRATTKQRMLEAILATPDPDANSGNGISLTERLVWMQKGKAVVTQADLDYIADRIAQYGKMADTDQAGRPGDIALARAFEAYGNITPLNTFQKMRIQRFVNMLLSPLSAMRNIIGNLSQNTVNAASDNTSGVFVDWLTSKFTGERTRVAVSGEELKAGWAAWAEESVNTFKDFYVDKAEASPADQGDDKFRTGQRGRAFQGNAWEQARIMEGFLMSFGDRNFWKMAFVNSLSNQQRTAELNGTMDSFDFEKAIEQARADANYATFNEDNVVKEMLSKMRETPGVGFFVDVIMPFTGVPTNIAKRMFEYSPAGLAWSFGKHLYLTKVKGANFDQRAFVNGVSRGLSGSMLLLLGIGLKQLGMIDLGTGEEEDEKIYNLRAAQGHQYSPYIRIGDDYISLTTFAPAASAITMGAAVWDAISGSESWADSVLNAAVSSMDQIFDASFMSGLSDAFGGDGSITENFATAVIKNSISQSVPYSALLGQIADSLDPYVRDTKDKSMIMGAIKSGVINKIPKAREYLLEAKTDITGSEVESKSRVGALANPLTMTEVNDDAVLEELDRLAEKTGSTSHIPSYLIKTSGKMTILAKIADSRKVNMDRSAGEHQLVLTARERSRYNKLYSQLVFGGTGGTKYKGLGGADTSFEGIREVMTSRKYQKASDEGKAKMISEILSKAKMLTQSQIVIDKGYVK